MVEISPVLISVNEACRMTSLSRSEINRRRAIGDFPQHVRLGDVRIAFVRSEVESWIRDRVKARADGRDAA